MEKNNKGIAARISKSVIVLFLILGTILIILSSYMLIRELLTSYNTKINEIAKSYAKYLDGDSMLSYVETGETDEEYEMTKFLFDNCKENTSGLSYLYVFVPFEDHFIYVVEGQRKDDDVDNIAKLGDKFEYTESEYKNLIPDIKAKKASERLIFVPDAGYGYSISAWAPVLDSKGNVAAIVEADFTITDMIRSLVVNILSLAGIVVVGLCLIMILLLRMIKKNVTAPIGKLDTYVNSYEDGSFKCEEPSFEYDDEINHLMGAFKEMGIKMDKYMTDLTKITAEKERIGAELDVATRIQASMLPNIFPAYPERDEFDIYASMDPAKEVGGDFYDFFMIDDNHLALVIADVSGKGVPAALFMMMSKILIKNQASVTKNPGEILESVNNSLCENNEANMFVTVWLGIVDISTGLMKCSNAGHEYPVIKRANGAFEIFKDPHGLACAAMEGMPYGEYEIQFEKGDSLFAYTDGLPEATNSNDELYDMERMVESLNAHSCENLESFLKDIRKDVDAFVADAPQFDDLTMLVFTYKG